MPGTKYSRRLAAGLGLLAVIIAAAVGIFQVQMKNMAVEVAAMLVTGEGKLHPIYAVEMKEKKAALSFDAAWGSSRTPQILQTLAKHHIKTTFFLTNIWLKQYPDMARTIVAAGHETGLHSVTHPHFPRILDAQVKSELLDNAKMITEITGQKPYLFRPPFGDYNNRVIKLVGECGYIPVQWSVDSLDWKNLTAEQIYTRVTAKIHPGAIILFHNDGAHTPEALEPIILFLKKEGYSIVPVSELLYKDNYYIDINGIQKLYKENMN